MRERTDTPNHGLEHPVRFRGNRAARIGSPAAATYSRTSAGIELETRIHSGRDRRSRHCSLESGALNERQFPGAQRWDEERHLPLDVLVMETDSPDIPPHWIYKTAAQRTAGQVQGRNEPSELPRIAGHLAALRGISEDALAAATTANALQALPKLGSLGLH